MVECLERKTNFTDQGKSAFYIKHISQNQCIVCFNIVVQFFQSGFFHKCQNLVKCDHVLPIPLNNRLEMTKLTSQSTAQSRILSFRPPHWPIHLFHLFVFQSISSHMTTDGLGAKGYWGFVTDLPVSHLPLFSFLPLLTQHTKMAFLCQISRLPLPFSISLPLLSLRPNYMVDRVIDTGESESTQQAEWGPS